MSVEGRELRWPFARACSACALALALAGSARAQPAPDTSASERGAGPMVLVVDRDDSDDDGTTDAEQGERVPLQHASEIVVPVGGSEPVVVSALGSLRVLRQGKPIATPFELRPDELPAPLWLQAAQPS
jgi:hypothetical protein